MSPEEYERRIAVGWDDTKALYDYWYGKVLFWFLMAFIVGTFAGRLILKHS